MIEEFRVRGWSHYYFEDLKHEVGTYRAVPSDKIGVVVRSLFRSGAKSVVIQDEASWLEAEADAVERGGEAGSA